MTAMLIAGGLLLAIMSGIAGLLVVTLFSEMDDLARKIEKTSDTLEGFYANKNKR